MLHKNTQILTPNGFVNISDVVEGDILVSNHGVVTVLKNELVVNQPLMRIRAGEDIILCTHDHKFIIFDEDTKFYYTGIPETGESLVKYSDQLLSVIIIHDVDYLTSGDVYHLQLPDNQTYIITGYYISWSN